MTLSDTHRMRTRAARNTRLLKTDLQPSVAVRPAILSSRDHSIAGYS